MVLTKGVETSLIRPVSPTMMRLTPTLQTPPNTMFLLGQQVAHHPHRQNIGCNQSILMFLINSWELEVICGCYWQVFLCLRPPVRAVCPNHEVLMFQPWTVITPNLGSVANYTFYSNPPAQPVSTIFLDFFVYPLYSNTPHQQRSYLYPLYLASAPHLLYQNKVLSTWKSPTPATRHLPASNSHLCALHLMPVSTPCPVTVRPSLFCTWPVPRSLLDPGGFSHHWSYRASVTLPGTT